MIGFPEFWLRMTPRSLSLLPASWLYRSLMAVRRWGYGLGVLKRVRMSVPVMVVGNIFVGGTGKTPLVLWLVHYLKACGRNPGIIIRGYGGSATQWPQLVKSDSDPFAVGDEPVLLAQRTDCPVMAGPDRVASCEALIEQFGCDVIVSDDGLQHYRLRRDLEIVVIDAARGLGNGQCLPAGPLREPKRRLRGVDLLISNGGPSWLTPYYFTLKVDKARPLSGEGAPVSLTQFSGQKVHAVAGIGNPSRFFAALARYGIEVIPHPLADHFAYCAKDISFDDKLPVLMTEKDAVKCAAFCGKTQWAVPAETVLTAETERALKSKVQASLEGKARRRRLRSPS